MKTKTRTRNLRGDTVELLRDYTDQGPLFYISFEDQNGDTFNRVRIPLYGVMMVLYMNVVTNRCFVRRLTEFVEPGRFSVLEPAP